MLVQGASVLVHSFGCFAFMMLGGREEEVRGCPLEVLWYCWLVKSCRINDGNNSELVLHSFLF